MGFLYVKPDSHETRGFVCIVHNPALASLAVKGHGGKSHHNTAWPFYQMLKMGILQLYC